MTRPPHALDRRRVRHSRRRLAVARDGHVIARDVEIARRGRHDDLAFEHDDLREPLALVDANVELRPLEARVRIGRREVQRARIAADDVDDAFNELDQRARARCGLGQIQCRAFVEA